MQKILIIGDRLSKNEALLHSGPFSGDYAVWFKKALRAENLDPIFVNAWEGDKITDFSSSRSAILHSKIKAEQAKLVVVLGFDTVKLLGLLQFVTNDRDQFDNLVNFYCDANGVRFLPLAHPRESMKVDHWAFYIKAGIKQAAAELRSACPPLEHFETDLSPSPLELEQSIAAIAAGNEAVCLDIETNYRKTKVNGKTTHVDNDLKSISWGTASGGVHVVSRDQFGDDFFVSILRKLQPLIEDQGRMKIGQNFFFDAYCLWHYYGIKARGPVLDTLHVSNVLRDFLPKSLNWIAKLYLRIAPWKGGHSAQGAELRRYNAQDVHYTLRIAQRMEQELRDRNLYDYWATYRRDLFEATFDMATFGLRVDLTKRQEFKDAALIEISNIEAEMNQIVAGKIPPQEVKKKARDQAKDVKIENLCGKFEWVAASKKLGRKATTQKDFQQWLYSQGVSADKAKDLYYIRYDMPELGFVKGEVRRKAHRTDLTLVPRTEFNPRSPDQKKSVLGNMGVRLERTKKNEDKDTTEKGAIRKTLALQASSLSDDQRRLLLLLLDHGDKSKMVSTYYDMKYDADGKWRYSYNIEGAETGRSSSSKTPVDTGGNSQNLPRKGKGGVNFKDVIVPSEGKILIQLDQKSAESVVVAYLAGNKAMKEEFAKESADFHTLVAKMLHKQVTGEEFESLDPKVQKHLRQGYKAVSHGASYGLAEYMLQELLFMGTGEFLPGAKCRALLDGWHAAFPEVRGTWHALVRARLNSGEAWRNVFGREHAHGGIKSGNSQNEMLAWEPQSTVPELSNIMLRWSYEMSHKQPTWGLQVLQMGHDAVVVEIFPQYVRDYYDAFLARANQIELKYPTGTAIIKWDAEVGERWGSLEPMKKWLEAHV